jgi:2-keto-3-deoxy-L-rhamnonate aldolase RhmA
MKITFKSLLERNAQNGKKFFGTYIMTPIHAELEVMKMAGVDFVIFDLEHEQMTFTDIMPMIRTCEACGLATLIRVSYVEEGMIKKALDIGASGIKVPGVSNGKEASQAVAYAKYPPEGIRGGCPFVRCNGYGSERIGCYSRNNRETAVSVIIEGLEGIKNMEEIIATPGVDTISVGQVDLSLALGVPGEVFHPKVIKAVRDASELCLKYGKSCSAQVVEAEDAQLYKESKGITHFHIDNLPPILLKAYKHLCDGLRANS